MRTHAPPPRACAWYHGGHACVLSFPCIPCVAQETNRSLVPYSPPFRFILICCRNPRGLCNARLKIHRPLLISSVSRDGELNVDTGHCTFPANEMNHSNVTRSIREIWIPLEASRSVCITFTFASFGFLIQVGRLCAKGWNGETSNRSNSRDLHCFDSREYTII